MRISSPSHPVPEQQPDAVISQANPISGDKYTVLDTVVNARITLIEVNVTWAVQPSPLEVHITIDGIPMIFQQVNPVSTQNYFASVNPLNTALIQVLATSFTTAGTNTPLLLPFLLEGRTIKVEVETTGGTVSNISARAKYAKW